MVSKILYIAIGLLLGLAAASGLFYFYSNQNKPSAAPAASSVSKTFNLVLSEAPADGFATSEAKVKLSGTTGTEAVVVVNGGESESIVQTAGGRFDLTYTLVEGENSITVTAFDQNTGVAKTITRNVLYLTDLKGL